MDAPAIIIKHDVGGYFGPYRKAVVAAMKRGTKVRIDGMCASACTIYLALPPGQVCATPRARLLFHQAIGPDDKRAEAATRWLMSLYPLSLRQWIEKQGGLTARDIIMPPAVVARFVPACK
jgi:hypothetical protein